jgi:hypothetical protein
LWTKHIASVACLEEGLFHATEAGGVATLGKDLWERGPSIEFIVTAFTLNERFHPSFYLLIY